jgi:hypothetical protein
MLDCETILQKGLATFFEVGSTLMTIREKRLYCETHRTFEEYCRDRWEIGRSYAWRVIAAAERMRLLPVTGSAKKPINEFQIRSSLKLNPTDFPKAWNEAISRAKGGKLTSRLLTSVVNEIDGSPRRRHSRKSIRSSKKVHPIYSQGKILILLHEAPKRIKKGEIEDALITLDNIESTLFGCSLNAPEETTSNEKHDQWSN